MKKVGVIGGSGFIGSYITKKFLEEGYKVKVSTLNLSNQEKYAHLNALPNAQHLEIAELNIENKAQLRSFVTDCSIVVHAGTPFRHDVKDPKTELFDPTIKGTENFLEIAQETPGIEKVVFIASVAAFNTNFPLPPGNKGEDDQISEDDTPFMSEESLPYNQAKFIANQTVERFVSKNPVLDFEITSVSPVMVMGRALSQQEYSTSMNLQFVFKNKIAPDIFIQKLYDDNPTFAMVDVEDVAGGIYKAATLKGIHGKNYLLASESYPVSDIIRMLNHQEPEGKPKIVYRNDLAMKDLGIHFNPAKVPLNRFSILENELPDAAVPIQ